MGHGGRFVSKMFAKHWADAWCKNGIGVGKFVAVLDLV